MPARPKLKQQLDLEALVRAAECLKTLAHPARLAIVQLLLADSFTVGELAQACGVRSHVASEHLRLMQRCGLLRSRRDGKSMYYEIAEPHLADLMACLERRFGGAR